MEDQKLVDLIINHPEEGMKQAMELYGPFVKAIIIKLIGQSCKEDIKECMADVFVKLWRHIQKFDDTKGSLKGYIAIIARNEAIRKLKQTNRYSNAVDIDDVEIGVDLDMDSEIGKKMNAQAVQEAIDELQDLDRKIFMYRFFWGKRVKEISAQMELEDKFIENRLYLGKKKLKEKLLSKGVIL